MNHYPRHIGDWMRDTAHLSEVEECIYSRMIDMYYSREKPLPVDAVAVCRLVRAASKEARAAVGTILAEFFVLQDDGWHQKRCDEELAKYAEKSTKAAASVSVRWNKRNTNVDTNVLRTYAERNTNQEPVTNNQEPVKPKATRASALPVWLPPEVWGKWVSHRGSKLTKHAIPLQIRKLDELRAQGHDPTLLVNLAIESGWATFWPPRTATRTDARQDVADQIFKRGKYADGRDITLVAERVD